MILQTWFNFAHDHIHMRLVEREQTFFKNDLEVTYITYIQSHLIGQTLFYLAVSKAGKMFLFLLAVHLVKNQGQFYYNSRRGEPILGDK